MHPMGRLIIKRLFVLYANEMEFLAPSLSLDSECRSNSAFRDFDYDKAASGGMI